MAKPTEAEKILQLESICKHHPGIVFSGFADQVEVTPWGIWSHVIPGAAQPSVAFPNDRLKEAESYWWFLAQSFGIAGTGAGKPSLVSVGGIGSLPWALIEIPLGSPVFDIFAEYHECPEFIVTNTSRDVFLAVTSEEYEVYIYLVKRQDARLDTIPYPVLRGPLKVRG